MIVLLCITLVVQLVSTKQKNLLRDYKKVKAIFCCNGDIWHSWCWQCEGGIVLPTAGLALDLAWYICCNLPFSSPKLLFPSLLHQAINEKPPKQTFLSFATAHTDDKNFRQFVLFVLCFFRLEQFQMRNFHCQSVIGGQSLCSVEI